MLETMKMASNLINETFEKGKGILRLMPVFVPRLFSQAGRRLRLLRPSEV